MPFILDHTDTDGTSEFLALMLVFGVIAICTIVMSIVCPTKHMVKDVDPYSLKEKMIRYENETIRSVTIPLFKT